VQHCRNSRHPSNFIRNFAYSTHIHQAYQLQARVLGIEQLPASGLEECSSRLSLELESGGASTRATVVVAMGDCNLVLIRTFFHVTMLAP